MIEFIFALIVIGVVLAVVLKNVEMAAPVRSLLIAVVVLLLCAWFLRVLGVWHGGPKL